MTTPLFMLRCCELGLSVSDLDLLTVGLITDMHIEKSNDEVDYPLIPDQSDFDSF